MIEIVDADHGSVIGFVVAQGTLPLEPILGVIDSGMDDCEAVSRRLYGDDSATSHTNLVSFHSTNSEITTIDCVICETNLRNANVLPIKATYSPVKLYVPKLNSANPNIQTVYCQAGRATR